MAKGTDWIQAGYHYSFVDIYIYTIKSIGKQNESYPWLTISLDENLEGGTWALATQMI